MLSAPHAKELLSDSSWACPLFPLQWPCWMKASGLREGGERAQPVPWLKPCPWHSPGVDRVCWG